MTASDVRVAVVTGASSGIGAAIARGFGALGWRVARGGRRAERLAEVARDVERAGSEALALARRVLPGMLAAGRGDVVFVSSENAVRPRPFQVGDSAAKSGVEAAAAALRLELEGSGVRVTVVRPGATGSEFGRGWSPDTVRRVLTTWKQFGLQRHLAVMPPEGPAQAVLDAVPAPRDRQFGVIELGPEGPSEARIV